MTDEVLVCAHCGAEVQGFASIGEARVCHPDDGQLPDCYRRVSVYQEPLGILVPLPDKPPGTENIIDGWHTWLDLMGTADEVMAQSTVCITHKRFIPCRTQLGCVISVREEDVETVRKYQQGNNRARRA